MLVSYPGDQGSDFQRQATVPIKRLNIMAAEIMIQRKFFFIIIKSFLSAFAQKGQLGL